ncbi:prolipoprotein diacylglyceryl transferase [Cellulomonas taurus]|uniref:prolipoprotein diacylglyceryl transferase n=1 Tax=Cellulomonas taurus TaxID=2729175 RepID=UPI00145D2C5B|nr:prolipoprotein diacylglyceryl transferase [Cellulomonas taurus]
MILSIPSPSQAVWHLGPLPLRAYALSILVGIVVAVLLTQRRWKERGGDPDEVLEIVFWAVPFGIVGGRIYHVITSPDQYFGAGGDPWKAFAIWEGGLGIWGAVALGAVGAYIGCRRMKVSFPVFADALAPGLLIAQAVGRLGNWFNQELFGGPTTLPWGLEIDAAHLPAGYAPGTLFHPTFLYELLWNLAGAALLIWLDRRFRLGHGRVFWLYVVVYTTGRLWIELVRIDPAHTIAGLRVNVWMSIIVGMGALVAFVVVGRRHPGRETGTRSADSAAPDPESPAPDATAPASTPAAEQ